MSPSFAVRPLLGDHVGGLPLIEQEAIQLGSGDGSFATRLALGRHVVLFQNKVAPRLAGYVVPDPDWIVLLLPLNWQSEFRFNGRVARPLDVFLSADASGYMTVGEARDVLALGVRKRRLERDMRALSNTPDIRLPSRQRLQLEEKDALSLRKVVRSAMAAAANFPFGAGRFSLPQPVEADMISYLAGVLLAQPPVADCRDPGRMRPDHVVRAALRAEGVERGESVTLARLCGAGGVGQAWLNRSFQEALGISPGAYLRANRLSLARARLLDRTQSPRSVKDVGLSLGFMNLGRFAADYRTLFKENPSETLAGSAEAKA